MNEQQKLSKFGKCYDRCYFRRRNHPYWRDIRKKCPKKCSKKIYGDKDVNNLPCEAKCETLRFSKKRGSRVCKQKCKENFETKTNNNNYLLIFIIVSH